MTAITRRQVQLPHAYFQKAKTEYADWRWAMIREFIQNSYDAQAAHIAFELEINDNSRLELVVADDGTGMDQDTLENVLLCMGGSRKPVGAVGGFGYAKAILFFAHTAYTIETRNLRVEGSGGEYTLHHEPTAIVGTRIMVEMDNEAGSLQMWRERIQAYVSNCYMEYATGRPVSILLDGSLLLQNNDGIYEFCVPTLLGSLWYNEEKDSRRSGFIVAVDGLPMFVEPFYSDTHRMALVGGIDPDAGSSVLTANRDGFIAKVREEFAEIVGGLVQDQAARRFGRAMDMSVNFDGDTAAPGRRVGGEATNPQAGGLNAGDSPKSIWTPTGDDEPPGFGRFVEMLGRLMEDTYPHNFHLKVDQLSAPRSRAATEAYLSPPELVREIKKIRNAKLARSWRAAVVTILNCEWALENGVAFYDGYGAQITDWKAFDGDTLDLQVFFQGQRVDTGFCFIAEAAGLCSSAIGQGGPHRLFINPLLVTRDPGFRLGDALDIAFHEAAHLWEPHHGESFCAVEGRLRQSVRRWLSEKEVLARMKR